MVVYEENSGKYSLFDVNVLPNVTDVTTSVQPMVVTGNQFTLALQVTVMYIHGAITQEDKQDLIQLKDN